MVLIDESFSEDEGLEVDDFSESEVNATRAPGNKAGSSVIVTEDHLNFIVIGQTESKHYIPVCNSAINFNWADSHIELFS